MYGQKPELAGIVDLHFIQTMNRPCMAIRSVYFVTHHHLVAIGTPTICDRFAEVGYAKTSITYHPVTIQQPPCGDVSTRV